MCVNGVPRSILFLSVPFACSGVTSAESLTWDAFHETNRRKTMTPWQRLQIKLAALQARIFWTKYEILLVRAGGKKHYVLCCGIIGECCFDWLAACMIIRLLNQVSMLRAPKFYFFYCGKSRPAGRSGVLLHDLQLEFLHREGRLFTTAEVMRLQQIANWEIGAILN
jgi:hypothetical protein